MTLDFKKHYKEDTVYIVICFDKSPLTIIACNKFILMSDLLREYAEWGGFDLGRLSYSYHTVMLEVR